MANNSFNITELDFDLIKNNFISYLRNQTVFSDYNFTGSGLNVLIDLLVKNTQYSAYYLNAVANESFLDSAITRDAIVSRAKELQYTPTSRRCGLANVAVVITPPGGNTVSVLTIPTYTEFMSEAIDGVNYTFITNQAYSATKNLTSNTFTFPSVTLYQGEHLGFDYDVTPTNISGVFTIPSANVDTTTLTVSVQASSVDSNTTVFVQNSDITRLNANSLIFFVEAMPDNLYGIYFGDGYLGKSLANGNIVQMDYLVTEGEAANRANTFTPSSPIFGFSNISVSTSSAAAGGAEVEDNETVRFRAPVAYTRQNRDVTVQDYTVSIPDLYPNIDTISVWGGADNDPPVYGKVFISMKPKAGFALSNAEKQRIIDDLVANRNVLTVVPEIVDPTYLYVLVNSKVYYDPDKTNLTDAEIVQAVTSSLTNYNSQTLGKFSSTLTVSEIQEAVNEANKSIRNNDLSIRLQKQFTPTLNTSLNYTINFNTSLHRGGPNDRLVSYPSFSIADGSGIFHDSYIEEVPFSFSGVQEINITNSGSGYTSTPIVTIDGDGIGATATAVIQNGKLITINLANGGTEYSIATVTVSGGGGSGAAATAVLSQRRGTLRTFYFKSNGDKIVTNTSAGTIDYVTGTITLTNFNPASIGVNPYYSSGILVLEIEPDGQTINPVTNRITTIDTTNPISIQVLTETI